MAKGEDTRPTKQPETPGEQPESTPGEGEDESQE